MPQDFDRAHSGSPPNKANLQVSKDASTVYTPNGQKRFNPFNQGKETVESSTPQTPQPSKHLNSNTLSIHKKPLTPTKEHPLKDLQSHKTPKSEFLDDSDSLDEDVGDDEITLKFSTEPEDSVEDNLHLNNNHDISIATGIVDNQQAMVTSTDELADDRNNNNRKESESEEEEGNGIVKQQLTPGKVVRRKKSPTNNNNNNNVKNNNHRMSYPMTKSSLSKSQTKLHESMTIAAEINGI